MCVMCKTFDYMQDRVSPSRTPEHVRVECSMQALAQARGVELKLGSDDHFGGIAERTFKPVYVYGAADHSGEIIRYYYNPLHHTPEDVWWGFLHELGHIEQSSSLDERIRAAWTSNDNSVLEFDAWNRAERMAKLSPWPPTPLFYSIRDECLRTHGLLPVVA